jgi:Spy/CpxP family protein refolding chaperone
MEGGRGDRGLFHGLKLSDTEKARVTEIRAKYAPEAKTLRESMKPAMQDARAAREKGDTAAARAAWDRTKDTREKVRALMQREQAEIRPALSPENQKLFDANVQQMAQRRAEWEKGGKRGHAGRFHGGQRNGQVG